MSDQTCPFCNSLDLERFGHRRHGIQSVKAFRCIDCGETFTTPIDQENSSVKETEEQTAFNVAKTEEIIDHLKKNYTLTEKEEGKLSVKGKIVVTSIVWGCEYDKNFFKTLRVYCEKNDAGLVIIPIVYQHYTLLTKLNDFKIAETELKPFIVYNNFDFGEHVRIMGAFRLNAALENPLSGLESLTKGKSLVFGHPQVALKTVPTHSLPEAPILSTTGALTHPNYSDTKQGYKASFNHQLSAVIVEQDEDDFFIRHLHFDGEKLYDLDHVYFPDHSKKSSVPCKALVTGDEHVSMIDESIVEATYTNEDSIVKVLEPSYIVRHDVLDCYSISHHHRKNLFIQFAKHHSTAGNIKKELELTLNFIKNTTPENSVSLIVSSNHNDHLFRWLNECDPKQDMENAVLYHQLMYLMLSNTQMTTQGADFPDPFELYAKLVHKIDPRKIHFINRRVPFKIGDIELSSHGDIGQNGSRGTVKQFSRFEEKYIIGHSHSPAIEKGAYQVGLSARKNLEYNIGASSWAHCHCVIYPNNTRQLLFIRNGKWRC